MSIERGLVDFIVKSAALLVYMLKYQHRVLSNVILWLYRYGPASIMFFNCGLVGWGGGVELFVDICALLDLRCRVNKVLSLEGLFELLYRNVGTFV